MEWTSSPQCLYTHSAESSLRFGLGTQVEVVDWWLVVESLGALAVVNHRFIQHSQHFVRHVALRSKTKQAEKVSPTATKIQKKNSKFTWSVRPQPTTIASRPGAVCSFWRGRKTLDSPSPSTNCGSTWNFNKALLHIYFCSQILDGSVHYFLCAGFSYWNKIKWLIYRACELCRPAQQRSASGLHTHRALTLTSAMSWLRKTVVLYRAWMITVTGQYVRISRFRSMLEVTILKSIGLSLLKLLDLQNQFLENIKNSCVYKYFDALFFQVFKSQNWVKLILRILQSLHFINGTVTQFVNSFYLEKMQHKKFMYTLIVTISLKGLI